MGNPNHRFGVRRSVRTLPHRVTLALSAVTVLALPGAGLTASGVRLQADGRVITVPDSAGTVRDALRSASITLNADDQVTPAADHPLSDGTLVKVQRVTFREEVQASKIPFKTVVQPASRGNRPYHPTVTRQGTVGQKMVTIRARLVDGMETERATLSEQVVRAPVHQVVTARQPTRLGSRGVYTGKKSLLILSSAYDPGPGSCPGTADGRTCNGKRAGYGIIAVDPKVIPLGTKLFVPGYGYGIAADVGGAIKGNRIDLGFNSRSGALAWGKKWVRAQVLD